MWPCRRAGRTRASVVGERGLVLWGGFLVLLLDVAAPNQRAVRAYERLGFSHLGSDWRQADSRFDRRILSDPRYAQIHRFFRQTQRGLEVEFFEMRMLKEEWFGHQWRRRVR
jgi:RimJ/RimL family protein N-acetyltransferase